MASGRRQIARDNATFRQQAAAARGIQSAYAAAARQLRQAVTSPADALINAAIADRLGAAGNAWKRAAAAAASKDKAGFARSGDAIKQAQADLERTLSGLEKIGYKLVGVTRFIPRGWLTARRGGVRLRSACNRASS